MSNFITLLVEEDTFQREILSDFLKDDGFEVIECATAEAAELIIATNWYRIAGACYRQQLSGCHVRRGTRSVC